jgi:ATP phosphoribosyltransferase regulatory subunit HisZ
MAQSKKQLHEGEKVVQRNNIRKWSYSEIEMAVLQYLEFLGTLLASS